MEVTGKVSAASHIMRLQMQPIFIIEFIMADTGEVLFIFFGKYHLNWHKRFQPGSSYQISYLQKDTFKGMPDIPILKSSKRSELILLNDSFKTLPTVVKEDSDPSGFVSLESTISDIIDDEIGIYKLDGNVTLIIAFIKELMAGLPGDCLKSSSRGLASTTSPVSYALEVGDKLRIFNAHPIPGKDDEVILVCCAKSLVRCERLLESNFDSSYVPCLSESGLLHCLHTYNLGLKYFHWLWDAQQFFISSPSLSDKERITRRKWNGIDGVLLQFVKKILKGVEFEHRSFVEEFTKKEHNCVLDQEFKAISPLKINDIASICERPPKNENQTQEDLWSHFVINKKEHGRFLAGTLKISCNGNLRLEAENHQIEVVIIGSRCRAYTKVGRVVAIYNFDYIEEHFNVFKVEMITKRYIVVHPRYILTLEMGPSDSASCRLLDKSKVNEVRFNLQVTSVSGMNYFVADLQKSRTSGFFIVKASVFQDELGTDSARTDVPEKFIKFQGSHASLYPFLKDPCIIRGKILANHHSEIYFKNSCTFSWLYPMERCLPSIKCVDVPSDFEVQLLEPLYVPSAPDIIPQIVERNSFAPKIVNIEGIVIKKVFMTPKFYSQIAKLPLTIYKEGIGVPGSKLTRILIKDKNFPDHTIWVYLAKDNHTSICQYPLGVIPGAEVSITWLERVVSNSHRVYLTSTNLTRILINNLSVSRDYALPTEHKFIRELRQMPSGHACLIVASLSSVLNVCFKIVCPACESEIENGLCSYVGCHAKEEGIVVVSSRIVVDDGSGRASVFLNELSFVRLIFNITNAQWNMLSTVLQTQSLSYNSKEAKSSPSLKVASIQNAFNFLITNPQNYRPLKIVGRIFPKSDSPFIDNDISLFGIKVQHLDPTCDFVLLTEKQKLQQG